MKKLNRRQFVMSAAAVSVAPAVMFAGNAAAAKVDPEGPAAKALKYVHESPDSGSICSNCKLWQSDTSADWGNCSIFPGQQVANGGWCSAWIKA